jgi:hypothetical protein
MRIIAECVATFEAGSIRAAARSQDERSDIGTASRSGPAYRFADPPYELRDSKMQRSICFCSEIRRMGIRARENGGEVASTDAKNAAESMLSRLRLTNPRRGIKAGAVSLIKGVNARRSR